MELIKVGDRLYNNRRKKVYQAFGRVASCELEDWEILYRSDDMPRHDYRRRSEDSFFELNRENLPRFVKLPPLLSNKHEQRWIEEYQAGINFTFATEHFSGKDSGGFELGRRHLEEYFKCITVQGDFGETL
jgi:hypothetical protein